MDWQAYLTSKGYRGRPSTGAEVAYPCFFDCNEASDSRKRKLYVNVETGLYSCKVCVSEGNGVSLMKHFGDEPAEVAVAGVGRRAEVLEAATQVGEKTLAGHEDALLYLLGPRRGLSPETVVNRRLGYASRQWPLTRQLPEGFKHDDLKAAGLVFDNGNEYYADRILIPYIENGRVVQLRGKDIFGRYYTAIGDAVRIYNADALKGATEAIVVEGEFDCMILVDLLAQADDARIRDMAVIGLAGVQSLPGDFVDRLSHLKRIWIGTDPDEAGRRGADKLRELLGERAFIFDWPQDLVHRAEADGLELKDLDWTTWVAKYDATWEDVAALLRVPSRLTTAAEALARFRNRPTQGMKTGFAQLDSWFLPGLLPGQVMVMLAKTGVGKTVLLCTLAYNLRRRNVLFITREMTAEEIWVRIARIYRFYDPFASDDTIAAEYKNLRICDANRLSEADFERLVEEYTDDLGVKPEIAFVDYLGYYARGRKGGSQYEKVTDAIMQLKSEAKKHQFVIITPAQVNRLAQDGKPIDTDDARDSGAIEETADLLVGVWRGDDALDLNKGDAYPTGKLHLKILKSRHGNKDKQCLLQMGLMSLVVVDDGTRSADAARRETHAVFRGNTYEQWLAGLRNHQPELRN